MTLNPDSQMANEQQKKIIGFPNRYTEYYPNTAITLCRIAQEENRPINEALAVSGNNNLELAWGPVSLTQNGYLLFIAKNRGTAEYFVVIGTVMPDSMESWLKKDFQISTTKSLADIPGILPGFPRKVTVSDAAFSATTALLSITDPITNETLLSFLQAEHPAYLYITGHGLGGTIAPVLYIYLNWMLYDGQKTDNMALWSFGALTAGGNDFNQYLQTILHPLQIPGAHSALPWRIQNSLDIIPFLFEEQNAISNIYTFFLPTPARCPANILLSLGILFDAASKAGYGYYVQPPGGLLIHGDLDKGLSWTEQAMLQHRPDTYQQLVRAIYN